MWTAYERHGLAAVLECYGFFTALHQLRRLRDGRSVTRTLQEVTEPEVLADAAQLRLEVSVFLAHPLSGIGRCGVL